MEPGAAFNCNASRGGLSGIGMSLREPSPQLWDTGQVVAQGVMQPAIRAVRVSPIDAPGAGPVRERAACLLENRHERAAVPRVHGGVEHAVEPSCRDEAVAVAVAPAADEAHGVLKRGPP